MENSDYVKFVKNGTQQVQQLFQLNQLVLLDFYADWCPPCQKLKPEIINKADTEKIMILACINVDQPGNERLIAELGVSSIPALFMFNSSIKSLVLKFTGNNLDKLEQAFSKAKQIKGIPDKVYKLKNKKFLCLKNHELTHVKSLPPIYPQGQFQCDLCKNIEYVADNRPMMHCEICNFDVCFKCCYE